MSNKTKILLISIGMLMLLLIILSTLVRWTLTVDFIQSPIEVKTRKMVIYRKESKDYKYKIMQDKANEGIKYIDEFWNQYPDMRPTEAPTPTKAPNIEGKVEKMPNIGTLASFPKYLNDEGAVNREKALVWLGSKYSGNDLIAFDNILKKESGYRTTALNEIGAGGICQAYPYTKMPCNLTPDDLMCQLEWCNNYIVQRYQTPSRAYEFHIINNWF